MNIQILTPNRFISRMEREEAFRRVEFFSGGSYRYTPSDKYLKAYTKYKLKVK